MKPKRLLPFFLIAVVLSIKIQGSFAQTDFWQQTNGPYGGNIGTLAINPATEDIHAERFHSSDNGEQWTDSNTD